MGNKNLEYILAIQLSALALMAFCILSQASDIRTLKLIVEGKKEIVTKVEENPPYVGPTNIATNTPFVMNSTYTALPAILSFRNASGEILYVEKFQ